MILSGEILATLATGHFSDREERHCFLDQNFGYSFPLFSSLLIKEVRRKEELITKVVVNKQCLSAPF